MGQEAKTLEKLLSDHTTLSLGFSLAMETFHIPDVRNMLTDWYYKVRAQEINLLGTNTSFLRRVERYLQIMEIIDDDGDRITNL